MTLRALALVAAALVLAPGLAAALPPVVVGPAPRGSILVAGDGDFTAANGVRGGSGLPGDPFVIEDHHIVMTAGYGIRIENTTAHVVIRDVFVGGHESAVSARVGCEPCTGPRGIEIVDASHVTVERARILTQSWGVKVFRSQDVRVEDVELGRPAGLPTGVSTWGVEVLRSARVKVANATLSADQPMLVGSSEDVRVERSTFRRNPTVTSTADMLTVSNASGVTFAGNRFEATFLSLTLGVAGLRVEDNEFKDAPYGVRGSTSSSHFLDGATFCGNRFEGIRAQEGALYLRAGSGIRVERNEFVGNVKAFDLQAASNITLVENLITGSTLRGGNLQSSGAVVRGNSFAQNAAGFSFVRDIDARDNWWGHASGPSGVQPGLGDRLVSNGGNVTWAPWLEEAPLFSRGCDDGAPAGATHAARTRAVGPAVVADPV